MKFKKNSLTIKVLLYLVLFSATILAFMWLFQVLFLPTYYEFAKKQEIKKVGDKLTKILEEDAYQTKVENLTYDTGICIEIFEKDATDTYYRPNYLNRSCLFDKEGNTTIKIIKEFVTSGKQNETSIITNPRLNNQILYYSIKINEDKYAFLNTTLDPIDTSIAIFKSQLIYITMFVLIASILIAIFLSKIISKPIININEKAKKLAKKDFSVSFKTETSVDEINELSETLDYVKTELLKTDELRRDLMANVSHDLKTPLTMIKAYAEMQRDLKYSKKKTDENMDIIINETDR